MDISPERLDECPICGDEMIDGICESCQENASYEDADRWLKDCKLGDEDCY